MRQCGFTFIGALHYSVESASFFLRGGARFLEEFEDPTILEPLFTEQLQDEHHAKRVVVADCLNRKDEKTLIRPELREASVQDRFALLARVQQVKHLITRIQLLSPTDSAVSTACEVLEDMKERGIPLAVNFFEFDLSTQLRLAQSVIKRQSEELWYHTYELATLYTEAEIQEFIGWLS